MSLKPRVVVVHRRTQYDELVAAHGTRGQAAFFLRSRGRDIAELEERHHRTQAAIVAQGKALGVPERGWVVAVATAMQESTLRTLNYGDTMSNGRMSSSRGLFQQLDAWGPLADRLDPVFT